MNVVLQDGERFYILNKNIHMFFVYCYLNQEVAEKLSKRLRTPTEPNDKANNWRTNRVDCILSERDSFNSRTKPASAKTRPSPGTNRQG